MNNNTDGFNRSRLDIIIEQTNICNNLMDFKLFNQLSESERVFRDHGIDKCEELSCISITYITDDKHYFNINVLYLSGVITMTMCDMCGKNLKERMFVSPYPCIAQDVDMVINYFDEFLDGFTLDTFDTFKPKQSMIQEIKLNDN